MSELFPIMRSRVSAPPPGGDPSVAAELERWTWTSGSSTTWDLDVVNEIAVGPVAFCIVGENAFSDPAEPTSFDDSTGANTWTVQPSLFTSRTLTQWVFCNVTTPVPAGGQINIVYNQFIRLGAVLFRLADITDVYTPQNHFTNTGSTGSGITVPGTTTSAPSACLASIGVDRDDVTFSPNPAWIDYPPMMLINDRSQFWWASLDAAAVGPHDPGNTASGPSRPYIAQWYSWD